MIDLIAKLAEVIVALIDARGDAAKEDDALMTAQETIKAEMDRRKFGNVPAPIVFVDADDGSGSGAV